MNIRSSEGDYLSMPENEDVFSEQTWPKVCSCGASITEESWERLHYVGIQHGIEGIPDLELRNCDRCATTLAIVVPSDFIDLAS